MADRQPRRDVAVAYTVRIELDEIEPPIWRSVRIRSDLYLPQLHDIVQDVMGWEDRHLHSFFIGSDPYRGAEQRYDLQSTIDEDWEDSTSVLEDLVRVDELLSTPGDDLGYEYDFGDGWGHRLVLQTIGDADERPAVCVDGARACPPEDCGGTGGYDRLLTVLANPADPEFEYLREWSGGFESERFDVSDANDRLLQRFRDAALTEEIAASSPRLSGLFTTAPLKYHRQLSPMLASLDFDTPSVEGHVAAAAMEKLTWFLNRIATEGVTLTGSGYLPPRLIVTMREELDWTGHHIIRPPYREAHTPPAHMLRDTARLLGLTKVLKGKLLLTKAGEKVVDDPVRLWRAAVSKMPLGKDQGEIDAGVLLLAAVAAGVSGEPRKEMMAESMSMLGWVGPAVESTRVELIPFETDECLQIVGAIAPRSHRKPGFDPEWGRLFALDCLRR